MMKTVILATTLMIATVPCHAKTEVQGESFDVLGSVMETNVKEINAANIMTSNKEEGSRYREKIIAGWWEFMQVNSKARPGEYCAAMFLRAKRVKQERGDGMSDGMMVTLLGPGGNYRGALLGFSPLGKDHAFPKLKNRQPVKVTLKQGNAAPVTLNAIYMEVSPSAPPLIVFAVPSIEALMGGMEDQWSFDVSYEGQSIANIAWHDGLKARGELKKCLSGQPFNNERQWKD